MSFLPRDLEILSNGMEILFNFDDDDSRLVVTDDADVIIKIDSSLNIYEKGSTTPIGNIQSEGDKWIAYLAPNRERIVTDFSANAEAHWTELYKAEKQILEILVERMGYAK